jgi:hypothetical protein
VVANRSIRIYQCASESQDTPGEAVPLSHSNRGADDRQRSKPTTVGTGNGLRVLGILTLPAIHCAPGWLSIDSWPTGPVIDVPAVSAETTLANLSAGQISH